MHYSGVFTIGALDFEMMMIVPKLMARFQQRAPNLKLQIVPYNAYMPLHDYLKRWRIYCCIPLVSYPPMCLSSVYLMTTMLWSCVETIL